MNIKDYQKEFNNVVRFVEIITTTGGIRNNEDK